jgi:hypothetical protein
MGTYGKFIYDAQEDRVVYMNDIEAKLWEWDKSKPVKYCDVLASVKDPTQFMEQTLGHNESYIVTAPIHIKNGNVVREELVYTYHPEDYQNRSLIQIKGVTNFLKVA